jgi:hypothetical protein
MAEFSRPATLDDLERLLRALDEHGVEYLLVGGYACRARLSSRHHRHRPPPPRRAGVSGMH